MSIGRPPPSASKPAFWPTGAQYSAAIQNLHASMTDPELRDGQAALNSRGLPLVFAGGFANVYQIRCPGAGKTWAVKLFKHGADGLQQRYQAISRHLRLANLPFLVDFEYLPEGVLIDGRHFPLVKMRWVEGVNLQQFVEQSIDQPRMLDQLLALWVKVAERLDAARIAHGDLQHGNVLLVPKGDQGNLLLTLIDFDGMYVPELSGRPSGEVGLAAYQHPSRTPKNAIYRPDVDRFSHLAICCALRCLREAGRGLWERFHHDEGLLFKGEDFQAPGQSALFRELWTLRHADAHALVGHLVLACQRPVPETPLVSDLIAGDRVRALTSHEQRQVANILSPQAKVSRLDSTFPPRDARTITPKNEVVLQDESGFEWDESRTPNSRPSTGESNNSTAAETRERRTARKSHRDVFRESLPIVVLFACFAPVLGLVGFAILRPMKVEPLTATLENTAAVPHSPATSPLPLPPDRPSLSPPEIPLQTPAATTTPTVEEPQTTPDSPTGSMSSVPSSAHEIEPDDGPDPLASSPSELPVKHPFEDFAQAVDLPALDPSAPTDRYVTIGEVHLPPKSKCRIELLGGLDELDGQRRLTLAPISGLKSGQKWDVLLQEESTDDAPTPIARIALEKAVQEQWLTFRWSAEAATKPVATSLRNCLLRLSVAGRSHYLALRTPVAAEPIRVSGLARAPAKWEILDIPHLNTILLDVALEGRFPPIAAVEETISTSDRIARTFVLQLDDLHSSQQPLALRVEFVKAKNMLVSAYFLFRPAGNAIWTPLTAARLRKAQNAVSDLNYRSLLSQIEQLTSTRGEIGRVQVRASFPVGDTMVELLNTSR